MQIAVADRYQNAGEMLAALQGKPVSLPATGPGQTIAPSLHVTPAQIDWGKVTFRQPPARPLFVENAGGGRLQVSLHAPVPWLQVTPAALTLGPQEQQQVAVECNPQLIDGRGRHNAAIQVTAGGAGSQQVQIAVNLGGPVTLSAAPLERLGSLPELVRWCDGHWQDAIWLLRSGELAAAIHYLLKPAHGLARRQSSETPRVILDRVQQASALPDNNLALETARRAIGAQPPQFTHNWREVERKLGMGWQPDLRWLWPWWGGPRQLAFVIHNRGRGYLHGRLDSLVPWLEVRPPEFGCRPGQGQRLALTLQQERRLRGLTPEILVLQVD